MQTKYDSVARSVVITQALPCSDWVTQHRMQRPIVAEALEREGGAYEIVASCARQEAILPM